MLVSVRHTRLPLQVGRVSERRRTECLAKYSPREFWGRAEGHTGQSKSRSLDESHTPLSAIAAIQPRSTRQQ